MSPNQADRVGGLPTIVLSARSFECNFLLSLPPFSLSLFFISFFLSRRLYFLIPRIGPKSTDPPRGMQNCFELMERYGSRPSLVEASLYSPNFGPRILAGLSRGGKIRCNLANYSFNCANLAQSWPCESYLPLISPRRIRRRSTGNTFPSRFPRK